MVFEGHNGCEAPREYYCTVCLKKAAVIDRWSLSTKTTFENLNSRSQFSFCLYPEGRMQDTGMLSDDRLLGEIEILCGGRKKGVFQEPGSRLPLLPAWHILNKGAGCQYTHTFAFQYVWPEVCLTQQARPGTHKASHSQQTQRECYSRRADTGCHLSIKGALGCTA